jgi:hypothetical protein
MATRSGNVFRIKAKPSRGNIAQADSFSNQITPANVSSLPSPALQTAMGGQILCFWHERFGHLDLANVGRIWGKSQNITLRELDNGGPPGVCPAFVEVKQHCIFNLRFLASCVESPLALIHCNSCGPF